MPNTLIDYIASWVPGIDTFAAILSLAAGVLLFVLIVVLCEWRNMDKQEEMDNSKKKIARVKW